MLEHGFTHYLTNASIDLTAAVPNIGLSQVGDPPVYYWLAALPLHFMHDSNITSQLYASRLVSLILYLVVILTAWGMMKELTPPNHALRWIMPITLILLPGFAENMTAVNNDVGAIAAFSLFFWAGVRSMRKGPTLFGLLFLFGTAALCYRTKNTAWSALPLVPIVLLFTWLRGRWKNLAWALFLVTAGIGLGSVFSWGDAALWYRRSFQTVPTRVVNSLAPLGEHAFLLDLSQDRAGPSIIQPLPPEIVVELRNAPVTLGAWVWSSQPMKAQMLLGCDCGGQPQTLFYAIQVGTEPKFFMFTRTLCANARHVSVILTVLVGPEKLEGNLYYDGLVLVKGLRQTQEPPRFTDPNGDRGTWGGTPFTNLLRNPSAEQAGPGVRTWANKIIMKIEPYFNANDIPVSLLDWKGAGWYYQLTGAFMFRTFWAKFGWGTALLVGSKPYRILAFVTLLGMAGVGWAVWRRRCTLHSEIILLMVLALLGIWIPAILRGIDSFFGWTWIPIARFAFPAILPTILVLSAGWLEILRILGRWFHSGIKLQVAVYLLFFVTLDALSILSIIRYYY